MLHLWDVYSAPAPSGGDVLALLSLCLSLAAITGGLLYHWLSKTLNYSYEASVQTACIYSVLMLLASFLCHPLRCVLTMTLPTVCTKQGRKLLVSASVMIVILNVVPNIALNVGAVARMLKCTTEGFTKSLLNSSESLNRAKQELVEEMERVNPLSNLNYLKKLAQLTNVDVSEVKDRFRKMIGQIELNFSHTTVLLQECLLLSNRILAAIFVVLLVVESSRYLKSYLSSVPFGHSSKELLQKESNRASRGRPWPPILPLRCRIQSHECPSCVIALLVVTFYFFVITLIVTLDHVVYHVVNLIIPWLLDFPSTSVTLDVSYKVRGSSAASFHFLPPHSFTFPTAEGLLFNSMYHPRILHNSRAHKLPPRVHVELRPRAFALPRHNLGSEPGGRRPAGMSLSDELLAGLPRGLRKTAVQQNLCILFQRAAGAEDRIPEEEGAERFHCHAW